MACESFQVDGVEEWGTVLVRHFYKAGVKMTPHCRDGIDVSVGGTVPSTRFL